MKFSIGQVVITDDGGYLMLKELLPDGTILWVRSVGDQTILCIDNTVNLDHLRKQLVSIYKTLRS